MPPSGRAPASAEQIERVARENAANAEVARLARLAGGAPDDSERPEDYAPHGAQPVRTKHPRAAAAVAIAIIVVVFGIMSVATGGIGGGVMGIVWAIAMLLAFGIIGGLYFLPTIVAFKRRRPNQASIAVVNFFLGWTLIGWVVAMAWAVAN